MKGRSRIVSSKFLSRAIEVTLGSSYTAGLSESLVKLGLRGLGLNIGCDLNQSGELRFIEQVMNCLPAAVCVDVGANVGKYSRTLRSLGAGRIYAFEPVPATFARLRENVGNDDSIQLFNVAVGETDQTVQFHVPLSDEHSTLASRNISFTDVASARSQTISVDMVSLDGFCASNDVDVDFIKIDVEGFELEVLNGAKELIARRPPALVQFEFNTHHRRRHQNMGDFQDVLPGYKLFRLTTSSMRPIDPDHYLGNIYAFQNIVAARIDDRRNARLLEN